MIIDSNAYVLSIYSHIIEYAYLYGVDNEDTRLTDDVLEQLTNEWAFNKKGCVPLRFYTINGRIDYNKIFSEGEAITFLLIGARDQQYLSRRCYNFCPKKKEGDETKITRKYWIKVSPVFVELARNFLKTATDTIRTDITALSNKVETVETLSLVDECLVKIGKAATARAHANALAYYKKNIDAHQRKTFNIYRSNSEFLTQFQNYGASLDLWRRALRSDTKIIGAKVLTATRDHRGNVNIIVQFTHPNVEGGFVTIRGFDLSDLRKNEHLHNQAYTILSADDLYKHPRAL